VAVVCAEHETYPGLPISRPTSSTCDCKRARTRSRPAIRRRPLDAWAERLQTFASGTVPKDLDQVEPKSAPKPKPLDVFAYVIHEGKVRAPCGSDGIDSGG